MKNIVEPDRRTRIARGIPKVTNTYSEYVPLIAFPLQQWLRERASLLRYTHIACFVPLPLESRGGPFTNRPWRPFVTQSSRLCTEEWSREGDDGGGGGGLYHDRAIHDRVSGYVPS